MIEELPACVTTANTIKGRVLFDQSRTGATQIEDGNQTITKLFSPGLNPAATEFLPNSTAEA